MARAAPLKVLPDLPDSLLATYLKAGMVAVDSELHGLRLVRDEVCLVQLCDRKGNVCLVRPAPPNAPPNLKRLLEDSHTVKLFHYALTDVSFLRRSLDIRVHPFACTKVMSKIVRTYANAHGLKDLVAELVGETMDKASQLTDWSKRVLTQKQLRYAADDVVYLISAYEKLCEMLEARGTLPSGISAVELNRDCQAFLPTLVELMLNGYGDRDDGWDTSLFTH